MQFRVQPSVSLLLSVVAVLCPSALASEGVPPPWSALRVPDAQHVQVWGRTYAFDRGPLPAQITSAGGDLLAQPARLVLDQRPGRIQWQAPTLQRHSPAQAALTAAGESPGVVWAAETRVAYDGLLWTTVTASGLGPGAGIEHLSLVVPVAASEATLYSHQLVRTERMAPGWRRHFVDAPEDLWNAGATPAGGWAGEFTPQVWVGSYHRGLAVVAETAEDWAVGMDAKIMFVEPPRDGRAAIRVDFAQRPVALKEKWQVSFGLMATPVRPPVNRPETYRIVHSGGQPLAKHKATYTPESMADSKLHAVVEDGAKLFLLWNSWSDLWGFPKVTDPEYRAFLHRLIDQAHRLGLRVMPYCGPLLALPDKHPEFPTRSKQFLYSPKERRQDPFHADHLNYRVTPTQEFTDWYVAQLADLVREFKFDGVYLDTIAKPDQPLQREHSVYALRQWRGFYERIYRVFHGDVIDDGYVFFHDSEPNLFMFCGFADLRLSGEMQYYSAVARGEVRPLRPALRDRMSVDKFFAWTSGYALGNMPTYWCAKSPWSKSYSVGAGKAKSSYRVGEILHPEEMFALCGLFNMSPQMAAIYRSRDPAYARVVHLWRLEDEINRERGEWFGFWDAGRWLRVSPGDDLAAAGFVAPGRAVLLHVANLGAEIRVASVRLGPATGLQGKGLVMPDHVFGTGSSAGVEGGELRVTLAAGSFVRVMLRPAPR